MKNLTKKKIYILQLLKDRVTNRNKIEKETVQQSASRK